MNEFTWHPTAEIDPSAIIGEGTKIWHHVHIRENVKIGADCTVGKGVYIDAGVEIGNRVKVQNGVSIYRGVTLADDVFVGPNVTFTNDLRPRSFWNNWQIQPTKILRGASLGANATVVCGITLGEYCMISAGAVVTFDAVPHGLYIGNPARLKGFVSKSGYEMIPIQQSEGIWEFECQESKERLKISFASHVEIKS